MNDLKPCPLCGNKVHWNVCGGVAAFGCGEYEFEVSCQCGILFNSGTYDSKEDAWRNGVDAWNTRGERTVKLRDSDRCPDCRKLVGTDENYCAWCGAKVER